MAKDIENKNIYVELKEYIILTIKEHEYLIESHIKQTLLKNVRSSINDDQWKDLISTILSVNDTKIILYNILCLSNCDIIDNITKVTKDIKILKQIKQTINSSVDLFYDNPELFLKYYEPTEETNENLLKLTLLRNDFKGTKILEDKKFIKQNNSIRYNKIFSPLHFAKYHNNKEQFELLEKYCDSEYYFKTQFLTNFVRIGVHHQITITYKKNEKDTGKDKDKDKDKVKVNNLINIYFEANSVNSYYYLGNKNDTAYFIFTERYGYNTMAVQFVSFDIPDTTTESHIEFFEKNSGIEYIHKEEKDSMKQLNNDLFIHYLDSKIEFIRFDDVYENLFEIKNGVKFVRHDSEYCFTKTGTSSGPYYEDTNLKHLTYKECSSSVNSFGIWFIPNIGWIRFLNGSIIKGDILIIPFKIYVTELNSTGLKFKISKEMINLQCYPTDYDIEYRLVFNKKNYNLKL